MPYLAFQHDANHRNSLQLLQHMPSKALVVCQWDYDGAYIGYGL